MTVGNRWFTRSLPERDSINDELCSDHNLPNEAVACRPVTAPKLPPDLYWAYLVVVNVLSGIVKPPTDPPPPTTLLILHQKFNFWPFIASIIFYVFTSGSTHHTPDTSHHGRPTLSPHNSGMNQLLGRPYRGPVWGLRTGTTSWDRTCTSSASQQQCKT